MSQEPIAPEAPQLPMVSPVEPKGAQLERVANTQNKIRDRLVVAKQFPRDEEESLKRIKRTCGRSNFAEIATWEKSVGGKLLKGPGIRLAEEVARQWGNFITSHEIIDRHDGSATTIRATAWDLETNYSQDAEVCVQHVKYSKKGGVQKLTTPDEIYKEVATGISKATRNAIFKVVPGYIIDEAYEECLKTQARVTDLGPTISKLVNTFAQYGVDPDSLELYAGLKITQWTSDTIGMLRQVYYSLRDGDMTADEIVPTTVTAQAAAPEAAGPKSSKKGKVAAGAKETSASTPAPAATASTPAETASEPVDAEILDAKETSEADLVSAQTTTEGMF